MMIKIPRVLFEPLTGSEKRIKNENYIKESTLAQSYLVLCLITETVQSLTSMDDGDEFIMERISNSVKSGG